MKSINAVKILMLVVFFYQTLSIKFKPKLSTELQINSVVGKDQTYPAVATLSNDNIVVIWDSQTQTNYDILAQIFNSTPNKIGNEIQVKTSNGNQTKPYVIDLKSKIKMVFFWQDKTTGDICFKIYSYNGTQLTDEIKANSTKSYFEADDANIRAAVTSSGNFFITWQNKETISSTWDIRGRLFDSDGKPLTDDFKISNSDNVDKNRPSVCVLTNDNLVVTYHGLQSGNLDVYFKIFDPSAKNIIKPEAMANTPNSEEQSYPHCSGLPNGGFVIAFATKFWDKNYALALQIYDKNGNPKLKEEVKINYVLPQPWVMIAPLSTDGFVVVYGVFFQVFYKVYSSDGSVIYLEEEATKTNSDKQIAPFVSSFNDGRFVIAWEFDYKSSVVKKVIGMNLFDIIRDGCTYLQVYSGRGARQILIDSKLPATSSIRIMWGIGFGELLTSDGNNINERAFYHLADIYYKTTVSENTSFQYIVYENEQAPCKVDILACYPSCRTCSSVGDSLKHNCDSCLNAYGYYPLSDSPTQCYVKTDNVNGYEFDESSSVFKHIAGYNNATTPVPTVNEGAMSVVGLTLAIVIPFLVITISLFIIFKLCRRRKAAVVSQATKTVNDGLEFNNINPTVTNEETGQSNQVKIEENYYKKF
jgi:hypothetical protein